MRKAKVYEDKILLNATYAGRILELVALYENLIDIHFLDKRIPIVVVTGLGKRDPSNKRIEWVLSYFRNNLHAKGYQTIVGGAPKGALRELQATAEMRVMVNSLRCVGTVYSSFAFMVNMLRTEVPCSMTDQKRTNKIFFL